MLPFSITLIIIYLCLLSIPLILTFINILNLFNGRRIKPNLVDGLILIFGPIFTELLIIMLEPDSLFNREIDTVWYLPLEYAHSPIVKLLAIAGFIGYLNIRNYYFELSPLFIKLNISLMFLGIIISFVWILFLPNIFTDLIAFALFLYPFNYIICCISIIKEAFINEFY
ncbi:MAG: DUF6688 family protein [Clostridiaceae bacterium]